MWSCRGFLISGHFQHLLQIFGAGEAHEGCSGFLSGAGYDHHLLLLLLLLPPPSPSLLEAFVIQSALFVQLENSTGLLQHPTSPCRSRSISWRHFSWISCCPHAAKRRPAEDIHLSFGAATRPLLLLFLFLRKLFHIF